MWVHSKCAIIPLLICKKEICLGVKCSRQEGIFILHLSPNVP